MKEAVLESIRKNKLIAIVRGLCAGQAPDVAKALFDGGIRLMEITVDQSSCGGAEDARRAIAAVADVFGGEMLVGGGTILTPAQVRAVSSAGAGFVLMPNTEVKVIAEAGALGILAIPGALTPTECVGAMAAGADIVKLFPAGNMGPSYVRALRAPLPHIPLLAVGGVDLSNVREFLACGMVGAGIGASIVSPERLAEHDYRGISKMARAFTEAVG